jgi:phosphoglycerate dehydrogenase-like enzyme
MTERRILFLPRTGLAQEIVSDRARRTLESMGEVVWNEQDRDYSPQEFADLLPGANAVITSWGSPVFTSELLTVADGLQVVGHAAGSVKHLMPKEGYDREIVVLSAAPVIADSVAEYTLWAMLSMQRDLYRFDRRMRVERGWKEGDENYAHELYRKTVGIVAASMVGRRVIALLNPFGCDVLVYDPYLSQADAQELGVRLVSLEELVGTCDIVSVHAPVTPETEKMIGPVHFQAMKDGALFVNTARAWVVDQAAMLSEMRRGRIRAVLDVFDREPLPAGDALRDMDNVFLTPHIAGFTVESRLRLVEVIADDMQRVFAGDTPSLAVSWERLEIMA